MGLSIGQIPAAVAGLRASPEFGRVRLRDDAAPSPRAAEDRDEPRTLGFGGRDDANTPRAGFGDGTLSPQAAALRTIRRTVEETRKAIPSLDDIRARFQAAAAEERRAAREAVGFGTGQTETPEARPREELSVRRVERRIPEAAAQARRFISDVSAAAAQAAERTGGEAPARREAGPSIQIGGERVAFTDRGDRKERPRFDVRV